MYSEKQEKQWKKCLLDIKSCLSPFVYNQWIKPLKLIQIKESTWLLEVPDYFNHKEFKLAYLGLLKSSFMRVNKQDSITFDFRVRAQSKKKTLKNEQYPCITNTFLKHEYHFDNFIIGSENKFIYSTLLNIVENIKDNIFNPIFIYGSTGNGKTHLLNAIGNKIEILYSKKKIKYITAELFYNDFISAIQENKGDLFFDYYQNKIDVLLIDDIDFFSYRETVQHEFFDIFNCLYQSNKLIVITGSLAPNCLEGFNDRLLSRFASGIVLPIERLDLETKKNILIRKAEDQGFVLENKILKYLVDSIEPNVYLLEAAIKQLFIKHSIEGSVSLDSAKKIIKLINLKEDNISVNINQIIKTVAQFFQLEPQHITSESRGTKEIVKARHISIFLIKKLSNVTLKGIGKKFGNRDHTSVAYAIKEVQKKMNLEDDFKKIIEEILIQLDNRLSLGHLV